MKYKRKNIGKEEIGLIKDQIEEKSKIDNPIISIVTPYYNAEDYIKETAKSVLNQTFTFFEWIIVDDGSSKESKEILKEIEKLDSRIRLLEVTEVKNEEKTHLETEKYLPKRTNTNEKNVDKRTVPLSNNARSCSGKRFGNKELCKKF